MFNNRGASAALLKTSGIILFLMYLLLAFILTVSGPNLASLDAITTISIVIFFSLTAFSLTSEKRFWYALPLVCLSVPNAVNNIFPSISMGLGSGLSTPVFSYITHIDIFLFLGLLKHGNKPQGDRESRYVLLAAFTILLLSLISAILSEYSKVAVMGVFQVRYFLGLALLFSLSCPERYLREIRNGIFTGVILLVVEASVYTVVKSEGGVFASGNFGVNTFAHILSAIAAYIVFLKVSRVAKYSLASILISLGIATGTRFSVISFVLAVAISILLSSKNIARKTFFVIAVIPLVFFLLSITPQGKSITAGLGLVTSSTGSVDNFVRTSDSSSIITRLVLWSGTASMILDNPVLGVGPGVWGYLKYRHGIPFEAVLDPHNDVLNILVCYGIPAGLILLYFIYARPLHLSARHLRNGALPDIKCLFAFNVSLMVSGLSNATLWKHQVALLFMLSSLLLIVISTRSTPRKSIHE